MITRHVGTLSALFTGLLLSNLASAQAPAAPAPLYTGNVGGGLALTGGNTDTKNFNLTAAVVRDPKTRNVIKGNAAYLRGSQNDVLNLDRTSFNVRDEYTFSGRTFVFGQVDYLRTSSSRLFSSGRLRLESASSSSTAIRRSSSWTAERVAYWKKIRESNLQSPEAWQRVSVLATSSPPPLLLWKPCPRFGRRRILRTR